jgi:CheY-like chemotaxis protein
MSGELLLNSWKEIAGYVGRSERTVQRWEKQFGFPVRRPAGKSRSAVIALPSEIQGWSRNARMNGAGEELIASREPSSVLSAKPALSKPPDSVPTLLCIDNHPEGLAVRKILLEAVGYRVLTASSGKAGLHAFERNPVDLVVLDYSLPDVDGEAVAQMLHKCKPRVPILLLSGAIQNLPGRVLKMVDNFIQKGQPTAILLSVIAELCTGGSTNELVEKEPDPDPNSEGKPAA